MARARGARRREMMVRENRMFLTLSVQSVGERATHCSGVDGVYIFVETVKG